MQLRPLYALVGRIPRVGHTLSMYATACKPFHLNGFTTEVRENQQQSCKETLVSPTCLMPSRQACGGVFLQFRLPAAGIGLTAWNAAWSKRFAINLGRER
jgi:hypothetical protein